MSTKFAAAGHRPKPAASPKPSRDHQSSDLTSAAALVNVRADGGATEAAVLGLQELVLPGRTGREEAADLLETGVPRSATEAEADAVAGAKSGLLHRSTDAGTSGPCARP